MRLKIRRTRSIESSHNLEFPCLGTLLPTEVMSWNFEHLFKVLTRMDASKPTGTLTHLPAMSALAVKLSAGQISS
jgi:hypothetical protein